MISNRPGDLRVEQDPTKLVYTASEPIGTITYGGEQGLQRNAIRLEGLPAQFQLNLGDDIGFQAQTPITSIMVQMTNATTPLTMDGITSGSGLIRTKLKHHSVRKSPTFNPSSDILQSIQIQQVLREVHVMHCNGRSLHRSASRWKTLAIMTTHFWDSME